MAGFEAFISEVVSNSSASKYMYQSAKNFVIDNIDHDFDDEDFRVEGDPLKINIPKGNYSAAPVPSIGTGLTRSQQEWSENKLYLTNYEYIYLDFPTLEMSKGGRKKAALDLYDTAVKLCSEKQNQTAVSPFTIANFSLKNNPVYVRDHPEKSIFDNSQNISPVANITEGAFAAAYKQIVRQRAPAGGKVLVSPIEVWANLKQNPNWSRAASVGDRIADANYSTDALAHKWGVVADYDPVLDDRFDAEDPASLEPGHATAGPVHTSYLYHPDAILMASRPPVAPATKNVDYHYLPLAGNVMALVTMQYHQSNADGGNLRDTICFSWLTGIKVIRPEWCVPIISERKVG